VQQYPQLCPTETERCQDACNDEENEKHHKITMRTLIVRPEPFSTERRLPVVCVQDSGAAALVSQYTSRSNLQLEGMPTRKEQECSMERRSADICELKLLGILNMELFPGSGGCDWIPKRQISRNSPGPEPTQLSVKSKDKTVPATSHVSNWRTKVH